MDNDKARSIVAAGKAHGQGGVIRLLLAYCASREPDPRAWLTHIQGLAERDLKGTAMPGLSDQESLLAMNAGLLTIRDLFDGLET